MTVIAKETRQRPNYVLDDTPQTAKIKAGETVTLEFRNQPAGKLIVALTMYLGRIGPITLALVFNSRTPADNISYADSKVIIG